LRYTARVINGVKIGSSPKYIQERLKTCGLRPINNVVDATNYVMLETGQPLHAFDFNKIKEQKIIIRKAKKGEKIITLDDEKHELDNDILVIADTESSLAIAGIKGGKKAEIDKKTKAIVLESANFNSILIRRSSQRINLRTDASLRFEHKIDPALTEQAINRVAELISKTAKGKVAQGTVDVNYSKPQKKKIKLEIEKVENLLGIKISKKEIINILQRLQFKIQERVSGQLEVEIPSFRLDINLPEGLIEEVGRLKGYKNIPSIFPTGYLASPKENFEIFWKNKAKNILRELGFSETYNYSFISKKDTDIFSFNNLIELQNPISSDYQYLRPSLIPNLLKNISNNFRFLSQIKLFELGKTFFKEEKNVLNCIIASNPSASGQKDNKELFYKLKGITDSLLNKMGVSDVWYDNFQQTPELSQINLWDVEKSAEIKIGNQEIGFLAVLVPRKVKIIEVMNKINTAGGKIVVDIDLFDIYEGESLPEGKKNLAFHMTFQSKNKTLSAEEINNLQNRIISALEKDPAWEVRK